MIKTKEVRFQDVMVDEDGTIELSVLRIAPFAGFKFTPEEGKRLSRSSRAELPEFSTQGKGADQK